MVTLSYWIKQKVWGHNLKLAKGDKSQYLLLQKNHFKNILSWSKYCHDIVWWGVWWFPLLLNSVVEVKLPLHFGHANNISLVDEGRVKEIFFFLQDAVHLTHFTGKKHICSDLCCESCSGTSCLHRRCHIWVTTEWDSVRPLSPFFGFAMSQGLVWLYWRFDSKFVP